MYQGVHDDRAGLPLEWAEVAARRRQPSWKFFAVAPFLFVLVDLPWLLLNSQNVSNMIENIQRAPLAFRVWAAVPVYLALAYLVSKPNSRAEAFAMGLCVYAVYDWTNLSTFNEYSWGFAIGDTVWGGAITSIVYSILTLPRVVKALE